MSPKNINISWELKPLYVVRDVLKLLLYRLRRLIHGVFGCATWKLGKKIGAHKRWVLLGSYGGWDMTTLKFAYHLVSRHKAYGALCLCVAWPTSKCVWSVLHMHFVDCRYVKSPRVSLTLWTYFGWFTDKQSHQTCGWPLVALSSTTWWPQPSRQGTHSRWQTSSNSWTWRDFHS